MRLLCIVFSVETKLLCVHGGLRKADDVDSAVVHKVDEDARSLGGLENLARPNARQASRIAQ